MKRVAFLNDTSAWYHWGCYGTSTAIREMLESRRYHITSVPIKSIYDSKAAPEHVMDFDNPEFFRRYCEENPAITAPILQSDIVVMNGEGSIHGLSRTAISLLYLAYASKLFCNKQVQVINHSCYPDDGAFLAGSKASLLYQGVYKVLDFVAVREHTSQNILRQLGVEATLSFDCLPLYIRHHTLKPVPPRSKTIVIAGSVAWQAEGIAELASYMKAMAAEGYTLKVLTGAKDHPAADDRTFVQELKKQMPQGWTHANASTIAVWLHAIQSASLLVSGRFHYTIAACMLNTPCIVLDSNTPKNRAICEEGGLADPLPYTTANLAQILKERTQAALNTSPVTEEVRQEWLGRAEKNFMRLI